MASAYDFETALRASLGVVDTSILQNAEVAAVLDIERSIGRVSGGMPLEVPGLVSASCRGTVFALSCDSNFPRPLSVTIEMVDCEGTVVGHDVPPGRVDEYRSRGDVMWMSEGFVLYPSKKCRGEVRLVMRSSPLETVPVPDGVVTEVFYPSVSSAEHVNRVCGFGGDGLSTIILGVDGL